MKWQWSWEERLGIEACDPIDERVWPTNRREANTGPWTLVPVLPASAFSLLASSIPAISAFLPMKQAAGLAAASG